MECLYLPEEIEELQNDVSFLPRILDIEVNNYEGSITVLCDRVDKIKWFNENKKEIATKFNFARTFKISFSVKDVEFKKIFFKLYGEYGEFTSKVFELEDWD